MIQATAPEQLSCSFCGKSQHEVRGLIEGGCQHGQCMSDAPPSQESCVFICDECVTLCAQVFADLVPKPTKSDNNGLNG